MYGYENVAKYYHAYGDENVAKCYLAYGDDEDTRSSRQRLE